MRIFRYLFERNRSLGTSRSHRSLQFYNLACALSLIILCLIAERMEIVRVDLLGVCVGAAYTATNISLFNTFCGGLLRGSLTRVQSLLLVLLKLQLLVVLFCLFWFCRLEFVLSSLMGVLSFVPASLAYAQSAKIEQ